MSSRPGKIEAAGPPVSYRRRFLISPLISLAEGEGCLQPTVCGASTALGRRIGAVPISEDPKWWGVRAIWAFIGRRSQGSATDARLVRPLGAGGRRRRPSVGHGGMKSLFAQLPRFPYFVFAAIPTSSIGCVKPLFLFPKYHLLPLIPLSSLFPSCIYRLYSSYLRYFICFPHYSILFTPLP